jgi:hypothetical protein
MAGGLLAGEGLCGLPVVALDDQLDIELGRRIIAALGSKRQKRPMGQRKALA